MKTTIHIIMTVLAAFLLSNCMSVSVSRNYKDGTVSVESDPPGAVAKLSNGMSGTTPVIFNNVPGNQNIEISVSDGHNIQTSTFAGQSF